MPPIRQVIYISKAAADFAASELHELATAAAQSNQKRGITGALLFIDNCFIQVLEGDESAISDLLAKLDADPRHHDIRIISDHLEDSRHFTDWSMGLITAPEKEKPKITTELLALSAINNGETASKTTSPVPILTPMPMPHTIAMMQRLYETDSILQQARG